MKFGQNVSSQHSKFYRMEDIFFWKWHQVLITTLLGACVFSKSQVHNILHDFQPIYYDHHQLRNQHERMRRSVEDTLTFNLVSKNRNFKVRLKRDKQTFHSDVIFEDSEGPVEFDDTKLYVGVLDDERSRVHGLVTSHGYFQGQIKTDNQTYFIDPSTIYFNEPQEFHSIIYSISDVKHDMKSSFCKADRVRQNLMIKIPDFVETHTDEEVFNQWKNRYTFNADRASRRKRAIDPDKTVCHLYMQADHKFYQKYGNNIDTVIEQLSLHIQALNQIMKLVDFDKNGSPDNIGFVAKRIKVHTDPNAVGYRFNGEFGVEKFLDLHSSENYDDYCLSYMFTDRDFEGGVLGLAWVASLSKAGGLCEKYRTYGIAPRSLNTGIVTVLNYGKTVASAVSHVTFAHEIGHNFGSDHDQDGGSCAPGGTAGNYIMYSRATSGYQPNNDEFSQCSIDQVAPIIENKGRSSGGCFQAVQGHVCGNKIVERPDEECDCGWDNECTETCCNRAGSGTGIECKYNNTGGLSNFCSPSEGPCCGDDCQLKTSGVCRNSTSCLAAASCSGTNYTCPDSTPAANGTTCDTDLVCYFGQCSASICLASGYQECQCAGTGWKDPNLCYLCCQDSNGTCQLASSLNLTGSTFAFTGAPCYNFKGYCDVFHVCREVDPSGPLSNISKLLLSGELFNTVKEFLTEKWWVAVLGGIAFFVLMGIFIKVCSKSHGPPKEGKRAGKKKGRVTPLPANVHM